MDYDHLHKFIKETIFNEVVDKDGNPPHAGMDNAATAIIVEFKKQLKKGINNAHR